MLRRSTRRQRARTSADVTATTCRHRCQAGARAWGISVDTTPAQGITLQARSRTPFIWVYYTRVGTTKVTFRARIPQLSLAVNAVVRTVTYITVMTFVDAASITSCRAFFAISKYSSGCIFKTRIVAIITTVACLTKTRRTLTPATTARLTLHAPAGVLV